MGQKQRGFESYTVIDQHCIFMEIKHLWVKLNKVIIDMLQHLSLIAHLETHVEELTSNDIN